MARYFLDTGVIVGATFLHDGWYQEGKRVIDSGNSFYVNEAVIFEYCNRPPDESSADCFEETDVDWNTDKGKFGQKLASVRPAQTTLNLELDNIPEHELTLDKLVDEYLLATHIYDEVDGQLVVNENKIDEDLVKQYIRPTIRKVLAYFIDGREITRSVAREAIDRLFDEILNGARKKREKIKDQVTVVSVPPERSKQYTEDFDYVDGYIDTLILCNMKCLSEDNIVSKIVSTDMSDMYSNKSEMDEITILHVKDKVADPSLPP